MSTTEVADEPPKKGKKAEIYGKTSIFIMFLSFYIYSQVLIIPDLLARKLQLLLWLLLPELLLKMIMKREKLHMRRKGLRFNIISSLFLFSFQSFL